MYNEQRRAQWLARWRAKRQPKREPIVMRRLFGSVDGDSEEKVGQRHTSRGEELAAEDRRYRIKGGGSGGLV